MEYCNDDIKMFDRTHLRTNRNIIGIPIIIVAKLNKQSYKNCLNPKSQEYKRKNR